MWFQLASYARLRKPTSRHADYLLFYDSTEAIVACPLPHLEKALSRSTMAWFKPCSSDKFARAVASLLRKSQDVDGDVADYVTERVRGLVPAFRRSTLEGQNSQAQAMKR